MFRRFAAVCLLLIPVLCTACAKSKPAEPITTDFVCEFRAQYQNLTAAGKLTRHSADALLLEFTEPETLNGLSAEWNGEDVTLRYLGLSYAVDTSSLPEQALGEQLLHAFNSVLSGEGNQTQKDGRVTVVNLLADHTYTYVYDAKTGAPVSLSAPSIPLSVVFENVTTP